LIQRLAQRATVLFSSHVLSEVEQVCERALVLLGGRLRADARLSEMRATHSAVVSIAEDSVGLDETQSSRPEVVEAALRELDGVVAVDPIGARAGCLGYEVRAADDPDLCRKAFRLARDRGWELAELRPVERDLESVFRDLVAEFEGDHGDGASQEISSATSPVDEPSGPPEPA